MRTASAAVHTLQLSPRPETLEEADRAHILKVLAAAGWYANGLDNGGRLGLRFNTFESRLKKLGISPVPIDESRYVGTVPKY